MPHLDERRPAGVLFDVGGTLLVERRYDLEAGLRAVLPAAAEVAGIAALAERWRATVGAHHAAQRDLRLADWLVAQVPALGAAPAAVEDALWPAIVTLEPAPGAADVLVWLADAGVRLGAVSNASFSARILWYELERHGLAAPLHFVVSSGDLGVRKPAPAIFHDALARLGTSARTTWFVGDTLAEDVVGATGAGLRAFWLTTAGEPGDGAVCPVRDWAGFRVRAAIARR